MFLNAIFNFISIHFVEKNKKFNWHTARYFFSNEFILKRFAYSRFGVQRECQDGEYEMRD